jgi:hypothetical protein
MPNSPPVFHAPGGRVRDTDGTVLPFESDADMMLAAEAWHERVASHPATMQAGGCFLVAADMVLYLDLSTGIVRRSDCNDDWQPAALSDTAN